MTVVYVLSRCICSVVNPFPYIEWIYVRHCQRAGPLAELLSRLLSIHSLCIRGSTHSTFNRFRGECAAHTSACITDVSRATSLYALGQYFVSLIAPPFSVGTRITTHANPCDRIVNDGHSNVGDLKILPPTLLHIIMNDSSGLHRAGPSICYTSIIIIIIIIMWQWLTYDVKSSSSKRITAHDNNLRAVSNLKVVKRRSKKLDSRQQHDYSVL
jgi:hypothetical protein